ncbi:MAG: DUF559 domain-containing protein [Azospirillaceae bacterium]
MRQSEGRAEGRARRLRDEATEPERLLWSALRRRQLDGLKFRRQVPVDRYIVDFLCESTRLVVEIDSHQHGLRLEADAARTRVLEARGYLVLRFSNADVLKDLSGVLDTIHDTAFATRRSDAAEVSLSHGEKEGPVAGGHGRVRGDRRRDDASRSATPHPDPLPEGEGTREAGSAPEEGAVEPRSGPP